MKILIACEYSGTVRDAFIARGHDAMSCDLLPTEQPGPHYQGDVRDILGDDWDMGVFHPPCTHIAVSGARHFHRKQQQQVPTNIVAGREERVHKMAPGPNRWKERSRTLPGVAAAMADQWGQCFVRQLPLFGSP